MNYWEGLNGAGDQDSMCEGADILQINVLEEAAHVALSSTPLLGPPSHRSNADYVEVDGEDSHMQS